MSRDGGEERMGAEMEKERGGEDGVQGWRGEQGWREEQRHSKILSRRVHYGHRVAQDVVYFNK